MDVTSKEIAQGNIRAVAWLLAGLFALLAVAVSFNLILDHNRNLSKPLVQRKIVGILWMVPIYAIDSWFSLRFLKASVYLDMFRDCYESYVIYLFLALMIAYLGDGDESKVVQIIEQKPEMPHPFPMNLFWPKIKMDRSFLRKCKFGTMQFVVVKPMTTIIAAILETQGLYEQGSFRLDRGYAYVSFMQNVSITIAFYDLALFYFALKTDLAPYKPVPKFVCVKAVLFLSFWQGVVLAGLAELKVIHEFGEWTVDNVSTGLQDLLLCFEMFIASIAHIYAFPAAEYKGDPSLRSHLLHDNFAFSDAARDFNDVMPGRVILPTGFKPGPATITSRSGTTTPDDSDDDPYEISSRTPVGNDNGPFQVVPEYQNDPIHLGDE